VRSRYGALGQGSTWHISLATALVLVAFMVAGDAARLDQAAVPAVAARDLRRVHRRDYRRHASGTPLAQHVEISVLRVLAAFGLAVVTAVPVGIAMGPRALRAALQTRDRVLPAAAAARVSAVIVIWLGIDESAKITLIFLACFAPLAMASKAGVRSLPSSRSTRSRSLGCDALGSDPHGRAAGGVAGDPDRDAHCHRFRLDHAGRSRDGGCDYGTRADGAERIELPAHGHCDHGHRGDRYSLRIASMP